jgi:hypothetical protein
MSKFEEYLEAVRSVVEGEVKHESEEYPKKETSKFFVEKFVNGSRIQPSRMGKYYFDNEKDAKDFIISKNKSKRKTEEYFLDSL